jgi:polysaccharide export outer membrane protein
MDRNRTRALRRLVVRLLPLAALAACGCQTVKTPESQIAQSNIPGELRKTTLPDYIVEPPDLIRIEVLEAAPGRPITGPDRLVQPNGMVNLEFYGDVYVAGLTTTQIKEKVILHLRDKLSDVALGLVRLDEAGNIKKDKDGNPIPVPPKDSDKVFVEVTGYNSKVYYVEGDVALAGRLPITGNETVLDALNYAGGLTPTAASQNIRLVRPAPPNACCAQVLPVNYAAIVNAGDTTTNYQIMPGDRLVVYRDPIVRFTVLIQRLAEPVQIGAGTAFQLRYLTIIGRFFGGGTSSTAGRSATPPPATVSPAQ